MRYIMMLVLVGFAPGCASVASATVGPTLSVSSRGIGYGWAVDATALELFANAGRDGIAISSGGGISVGGGQTFRPVAAKAAADEGALSNLPLAVNAPRAMERVTYLAFGLRISNLSTLPTYSDDSIAGGPAWISRDGVEPDERSGIFETAAEFAGVPARLTSGTCGNSSVTAPAFIARVGVRRLGGVWELFVSPQVGIVNEKTDFGGCL